MVEVVEGVVTPPPAESAAVAAAVDKRCFPWELYRLEQHLLLLLEVPEEMVVAVPDHTTGVAAVHPVARPVPATP
jgi:hypothetical protein